MTINTFQLSEKCPFSCLKCTINKPDSTSFILKKIKESPKETLNIFFNLTINNKDIKKIIKQINHSKQKLGFFYNGLPKEEYLKHSPNLIAFPLFSTNQAKHDLFVGKTSFNQTISFVNSLPSQIQKPIVFFVTKENLSETTDLLGLSMSLKTKIYIQPLMFFENNDFSKEIMLYLKRIGKEKNIKLLEPGKLKMLCLNWKPAPTLYQYLYLIKDTTLKIVLNLNKKK